MIRRMLLLATMSLPSLPGANCDKILGTWQGTPDSSTDIRVEVAGQKRRLSICMGAGRCVVGPVVFDYDGKRYESKVGSNWVEYVTFRKVNATTIEQHDLTNKGAL